MVINFKLLETFTFLGLLGLVLFSKWLKQERADGAPKILEVISAIQCLGNCFYVKMATLNPCQEHAVFLTFAP